MKKLSYFSFVLFLILVMACGGSKNTLPKSGELKCSKSEDVWTNEGDKDVDVSVTVKSECSSKSTVAEVTPDGTVGAGIPVEGSQPVNITIRPKHKLRINCGEQANFEGKCSYEAKAR